MLISLEKTMRKGFKLAGNQIFGCLHGGGLWGVALRAVVRYRLGFFVNQYLLSDVGAPQNLFNHINASSQIYLFRPSWHTIHSTYYYFDSKVPVLD